MSAGFMYGHQTISPHVRESQISRIPVTEENGGSVGMSGNVPDLNTFKEHGEMIDV